MEAEDQEGQEGQAACAHCQAPVRPTEDPSPVLCRICRTLDALLRSLTRVWHTRARLTPPSHPPSPRCRLCWTGRPAPAPALEPGAGVGVGLDALCAPCQSRLTTTQAVASDWTRLTRARSRSIHGLTPIPLSQCRVWVLGARPGAEAQMRPNPFAHPSPCPPAPDPAAPVWRLWLLPSQYEVLQDEAERRVWRSGRPPLGFKLRPCRSGAWDIWTCGAWARDQGQPWPDPDPEPLTVTCLLCGQTWPSLQSGMEHALDHDGAGHKPPQPRPPASVSGAKGVAESHGQSCGTCGKVFFKPSQLENHLRAHRGEKPFQCDLCHKGFTRKAYYQEHRARHDGLKDKECHICQKKFYATSYYRHMATIHPESEKLKHVCSVCGKHFALKYKLQLHEKTHVAYDERAFVCENCPEKRFSTQSHLNNHMNQVHGLKGLSCPFLCQDCGKSFNALTGLQAHRAKHHLNTDLNAHPCSACPLRFPSLKSLKHHAEVVHPESVPGASESELLLPGMDPGLPLGSILNPAPVGGDDSMDRLVGCSQSHEPELVETTLAAGANLADSIVVEENGRPKILLRTNEGDFLVPLEFKDDVECEEIDPKDLDHYLCDTGQTTIGKPNEVPCESCGKTFRTRKARSQHIRNVHSQETFSCATCSKSFATQHYLKMHEKVHSTKKEISCQVCQRLFKFDKDLKKHMRTHTGEKPYGCSDCGKTFTNTSNLAEHRTLHTGKLNYPCPNCKRRFRIWSSMNKHYLRGQCSNLIPEKKEEDEERGESTTLIVNSTPAFDLTSGSIPVEETQIYVIKGVV